MKKFRGSLTFKQALVQLILNGVSLGIAIWLVGSVTLQSPIGMFTGAALISILQVLSRSFFSFIARMLGVFGILLISLLGNAILVWLAFSLVPSITVTSFWGGVVTAWVYAGITTLLQWVLLSQSDDVYLGLLTRDIKRTKKTFDKPAFLYIQLDGVSAPVLDWQLKAGNLPNIGRLIQRDGYRFRSWQTQIPSTTPASQAGILFGANDTIPAFRWYEKETGELVVANQSHGARLIESRCSTGDGLLADGGVSIGNLFSGDAPTNIMVMSKLHGDKQAIRSIKDYSQYFYSSTGFIRSVILSVGEMIKEVYQARRQEQLDMQPRIKRHGSYIALRAATNVFLRDLQTSIVIQNMMKGANSIYVDFLDYDEVAHHAGPARAESLASLSGLDRVVGILDKARSFAPRPYELILLSDHGQSQGRTFKQLHHGKDLKDFVSEFIGENVSVSAQTDLVEQETQTLQLQRKSSNKLVKPDSEVIITGSGNLGNIWFKSSKLRLKLEEIDKLYPKLIQNLLKIEGIGLVLVDSKQGPLCLGRNGSVHLKTGLIDGKNPLVDYSFTNIQSLHKLRSIPHAPDVCVISSFNQETGEVHAFEELVGNHGGIGGWQTEAILLHPGHLQVPKKFEQDGAIVDSVNIHKILKSWL